MDSSGTQASSENQDDTSEVPNSIASNNEVDEKEEPSISSPAIEDSHESNPIIDGLKDVESKIEKRRRITWYDFRIFMSEIFPKSFFTSSFFIYLVILCFSMALFRIFDYEVTDQDNARYILSGIAQSQAALVAIVITISLIIIQLVAQLYTPTALRILLKDKDFLSLIIIYIFSITLDIIVLGNLSTDSKSTLTDSTFVLLSISSMIGALIAIIPYLFSFIEVLNPITIFNKIEKTITVKNVEKKLGPLDLDGDDEILIMLQPLFDLLSTLIKKNDTGSAIKCIRSFKVICDRFYEPQNPNSSEFIAAVSMVIDNFSESAILAIDNQHTMVARECIHEIEKLAKIELQVIHFLNPFSAMATIGIFAARKKSEAIIHWVIVTSDTMGHKLLTYIKEKDNIQHHYSEINSPIWAIHKILSTERKMIPKEYIIKGFNSMKSLALEMANQKLEQPFQNAIEYILKLYDHDDGVPFKFFTDLLVELDVKWKNTTDIQDYSLETSIVSNKFNNVLAELEGHSTPIQLTQLRNYYHEAFTTKFSS